MLPPRRAAMAGSGHSFRTWVRLRPRHITDLHGRRAGTSCATWATFQHRQFSVIHPNSYTVQRTAEPNTELSLTKTNFFVLAFSNSEKQHANSTSVKSRQHPNTTLCLKSASTGQRKHNSLLPWATTSITPPLFQSPSQTPANGLSHTILSCPVLNFPVVTSPALRHNDLEALKRRRPHTLSEVATIIIKQLITQIIYVIT